MAPPRSVSFYPWMICVFTSFIERSIHVVGYSECYSEAEKASIPAALMCYNNHVTGPRVILDVLRAKDSSTTECVCTVTSDTPTKFNFSMYKDYIRGPGCGSTLLFVVNGESITRQCHVEDMQLPSSNHSDTSVNIQIKDPQTTINTKYCVLIESEVALNLSCSGDSLQSLLTTSTVSTTEPLEISSIPTKDTSTLQSTSQTLLTATDKIDTTSSYAVTTQSQSITSSTSQPIATTEEMETTSLSSLPYSSTASSQPSVTTGTSTELTTLENTSVIPDTTEKATVETIVSSTASPETTTQMSSSKTTTDSTTIVSTESGVHDTTTTLASQSSTKSGAQYTTTIDISQTSTDGGEQSTATNATSRAPISSEIQTTTTLESTQSSSASSTQRETMSTSMTTQGVIESTSKSSVTQKPTTIIPIVKSTLSQATEEVPWSVIIPAILLGVILFAALLIAFIKWQRSREIKYPPDSSYSDSVDSSNKYPPIGETNFGYDAYEEDSGIVAEFSRGPEELEIEFADEGLDPKNLTKGPFIRYNVKDYSRNTESANYSSVRKQTPNGMDVYF